MEFLIWLVLALVILRPLWGRWDSALPVGVQPAATVPLFNLWTGWWNADRLRHGLADYWQAPIFHPTAGAFAFSEPQPTLMAVAPVAWWGSPTLAYNIYLAASLTLNGWFGARLIRRLASSTRAAPQQPGCSATDWFALAGGAMCMLLPFVHWQIGVLQLVPLWGVLWTLSELDELAESPGPWCGVRLGLAFGVTYWLCNYYGLFLSVLLAVCAPWLVWRGWLKRRTWVAVALAGLTAAALAGPIVWAQLHYLLQHRFEREATSVLTLAATWSDFAIPRGRQWMGTANLFDDLEPRWKFNPGYLKTLLLAIGLIGGVWQPDRRRRVLFWGLFTAAALLLAAAPRVGHGSWTLQQFLVQHWPGFAQIRTPYRFVVFAQISSVILAVEGLRVLWRLGRSPLGSRLAGALVAGIAALAVTEVLPWLSKVSDVPVVTDDRHWAYWLRDNTAADDSIVNVPFTTGTSEEDHEVSTGAMFYQTVHHRPLVEGYSGFFPQTYRDLRGLMPEFPNRETLDRLALFGVRFVVVDAARMDSDRQAALAEWPSRLHVRYVDEARHTTVYELTSDSPPPAP